MENIVWGFSPHRTLTSERNRRLVLVLLLLVGSKFESDGSALLEWMADEKVSVHATPRSPVGLSGKKNKTLKCWHWLRRWQWSNVQLSCGVITLFSQCTVGRSYMSAILLSNNKTTFRLICIYIWIVIILVSCVISSIVSPPPPPYLRVGGTSMELAPPTSGALRPLLASRCGSWTQLCVRLTPIGPKGISLAFTSIVCRESCVVKLNIIEI